MAMIVETEALCQGLAVRLVTMPRRLLIWVTSGHLERRPPCARIDALAQVKRVFQ